MNERTTNELARARQVNSTQIQLNLMSIQFCFFSFDARFWFNENQKKIELTSTLTVTTIENGMTSVFSFRIMLDCN